MKLTTTGFQLSPTDLSNHLSCAHLTQLRRAVAEGRADEPHYHDPALEALSKRGQEHEDAYVTHLQAKGLTVVNLRGKSVADTVAAMASGADVIVQAQLAGGAWMGYADILLKVNGASKFGDWKGR